MPCITGDCKWRPPGECVYYSGSQIADFNISSGDNLNVVVSKLSAGILAGTGAGSETANVAVDSNSIDLTLSGVNNRTIRADVRRDSQAGNKLSIGVGGLYVAPATFSSTYDSNSGVLSLTIDGTTQTQNLGTTTVISVFGRTGAILAQSNDYTWAQIGSKPTSLAGFGITDPVVLQTGSYTDPAWITTLAKAKVGLGNVDNTSDANKPVSSIQQTALNLKAPLASPAFTGIPTAPTATTGTNTAQIATTAFVLAQVAAVSSGVTTFNGRSGTVVPATNDYTWAQINKATSSIADLTTRSATDLLTGTLSDSLLSSNVPLLNINNTFTGTITLGSLAGTGTRVVKASSTGVLSAAALTPSDVALSNVQNVNQTIATNITSGTLADGRLSANVPLLSAVTNTFLGNIIATGSIGATGSSSQLSINRRDTNATAGYIFSAAGDLSIFSSSLAANVLSFANTTGVATLSTLAGSGTRMVVADASGALSTQAIPSGGSSTTDASLLTTGTLADARLSANVPLLNVSNTFTAAQRVTLTTEQMRIGYDATNYFAFSVASNGTTTLTSNGTVPAIVMGTAMYTTALSTNLNTTSANFTVFAGVSTLTTTSATLIRAGGAGTLRLRIGERGSGAAVMAASEDYASHVIGTQAVTIAASGTHAMLASLMLKPLTTGGSGATVTDTATLLIEGAATTSVGGNNYALWSVAGLNRFGGNTTMESALTVNGAINVGGAATLSGAVNMGSTLTVTSGLTVNSTATITGVLTIPTAAPGTNTTQAASTAFVAAAIAAAPGGGGTGVGPLYVILPTDQVNNNATANTWQDVTGLAFPVTAGDTVAFEFNVWFTSAASTTGSRWGITGPASPTLLSYSSQFDNSNNAFNYYSGWTTYDPASMPLSTTSNAVGNNNAIVRGIIKASITGTVTLRFASEISGSAITALSGISYVRYTKIS